MQYANSYPNCLRVIAQAASCQVYPSEYAYNNDSVNRIESPSANCGNYPPGPHSTYIHCEAHSLD